MARVCEVVSPHLPLALLSLVLVAACSGAPPPAALNSRDFLSTAVSEDGAAKSLVPGTRIQLRFVDGQVNGSAGCNSMSGGYTLADGRLVVDGLGMTEMGCDPARHAQDEWLAAFLTARPALALDGNNLLLTGSAVIMRLVDRRVAEPDLPLAGTLWTVESVIVFDGVSSVPGGVMATLQLRADGGFDVATGCNSGGGRFTVADDGLRFTELNLTRMACAGAAGQMETHLLRILQADVVTYEIESRSLTLQTGEVGLVLRGE